MSSVMPAAGAVAARPARNVPPARRARAVLAAEWIKLRSLRSLPVTVAAAAVFCVGLATLVCVNYRTDWHHLSASRQAAFNPVDVNFGFLRVGMLFFGMLGALVVTTEYGDGLIRTTFAATPQRGLVLAAKTALVGVLVPAVSAVICFAAFFAGQSVLSGRLPHARLADPGVLGHVLGAVAYSTAVGLCGVFIGVLARATALAVTGLFGFFLMLPVMADQLPHTTWWRRTVPYLPTNLGESLWHSRPEGLLSGVAAWILLPAWVVGLGALAVAVLRRRDA